MANGTPVQLAPGWRLTGLSSVNAIYLSEVACEAWNCTCVSLNVTGSACVISNLQLSTLARVIRGYFGSTDMLTLYQTDYWGGQSLNLNFTSLVPNPQYTGLGTRLELYLTLWGPSFLLKVIFTLYNS